jgi:RNA polymerase sigma factor (TIGR02999 family)
MASERPGHSLDATAVVHEAYLRLVGHQTFEGRRHFFAAAAEAMRRILVEAARRRSAQKRGGELRRVDLNEPIAAPSTDDELLALDEALELLESHDADAARLVKLRYFAGMTHSEAAESLGVSRRVADRLWVVAKTWLFQQIKAN